MGGRASFRRLSHDQNLGTRAGPASRRASHWSDQLIALLRGSWVATGEDVPNDFGREVREPHQRRHAPLACAQPSLDRIQAFVGVREQRLACRESVRKNPDQTRIRLV